MAEIVIEAAASGATAPTGAYCDGTAWGGVSFDHAALVSARRSRADAADFWLYHATAGQVGLVAVTGANSATCRVLFNLAAPISSGASDAGYRLVFGDLGWQTSRATAAAGSASAALSVATVTVPALTLPSPARPLEYVKVYDVDALAGDSGALVRRRKLRNQNSRRVAAMEWRDPGAEDWYEVQAWVDALAGGAGAADVPGWLATQGFETARCAPVPGSLEIAQQGRRKHTARLVVEEVVA